MSIRTHIKLLLLLALATACSNKSKTMDKVSYNIKGNYTDTTYPMDYIKLDNIAPTHDSFFRNLEAYKKLCKLPPIKKPNSLKKGDVSYKYENDILFGCHINNYDFYRNLLEDEGQSSWNSLLLIEFSNKKKELYLCINDLHSKQPSILKDLEVINQISISEDFDFCTCASNSESLLKSVIYKVFNKGKFNVYYSFIRADNIDIFSKNCKHTCLERGDLIVVDTISFSATSIPVYFQQAGDMSSTFRHFFIDSKYNIYVFQISELDDFYSETFKAIINLNKNGEIIVQ